MAWENSTATNHVDLFNKLRNFLTTNATLLGLSQEWEQVKGNTGILVESDKITLRGQGLAGTDNIYCGLKLAVDSNEDYYNLVVWGHGGYNAAEDPDNQPLSSIDHIIPLWDQPMDYWFIANGRRFIIVVKVSTVYTSGYVGLMLPYATPVEYPLPYVVAGNRGQDTTVRWGDDDDRLRFMVSPGYNGISLFYPDNVWRQGYNYSNSVGNAASTRGDFFMYPTRLDNDSDMSSQSDDQNTETLLPNRGSTYVLRQAVMYSQNPYIAQMGVLEGIHWLSGRSNSVENIIDVNSQDYMTVQNVNRAGFRDYMTVRLL